MPGWPQTAGNQRPIMSDRSKKRRRASWRGVRLHRQFTIADAAVEAGVCRATIRRWIKDGLPVLPGPRPTQSLAMT